MRPLTALDDFDNIILLGGPGCGKTTLLRYWAMAFSGNLKRQINVRTTKIPILVSLRSIESKPFHLFHILTEELSRAGLPRVDAILRDHLEKEQCLILLDGLDELSESQSKIFLEEVLGFRLSFPGNKIVLSCRTAAFVQTLQGFVEFEIEDFDAQKKYSFIEDWFTENRQKANRLKSVIRLQPLIAELATTPILLSLICILYDRDLSLPKNRTELYSRAVDVMIRDWDVSRNFRRESKYEMLSDIKKIRLLSYVAFTFFTQNKKIFQRKEIQDVVSEYIGKFGIEKEDAREVIHEICSHHGLIFQVTASSYAFSHLTLQEYFTALHIIATRGELRALAYVGNARWIEVLANIAALLEDSSDFLRRIYRGQATDFYTLCLAGYCISGHASVDSSVKEEIVALLLQELRLGWFGRKATISYSSRSGVAKRWNIL